MSAWPLQLMVVTLAERSLPEGLLDQLRASRAAGVIHLVDGGIVHKGNEGELSLHPTPGIVLDRGPYTGKLVSRLFGCGTDDETKLWQSEQASVAAAGPQLFGLSPDDLAEIADTIPRASDVLVLLIEHRWTVGFAESAEAGRGVLLAQGSVVPRTLLELSGSSESRYDLG